MATGMSRDLNMLSQAKTLQKFWQFDGIIVFIRINMDIEVPNNKKRICTQNYWL